MTLTKKNIEKWKNALALKMAIKHGIEGYEQTLSNEEWLKSYEGYEPEKAIKDEEECMED